MMRSRPGLVLAIVLAGCLASASAYEDVWRVTAGVESCTAEGLVAGAKVAVPRSVLNRRELNFFRGQEGNKIKVTYVHSHSAAASAEPPATEYVVGKVQDVKEWEGKRTYFILLSDTASLTEVLLFGNLPAGTWHGLHCLPSANAKVTKVLTPPADHGVPVKDAESHKNALNAAVEDILDSEEREYQCGKNVDPALGCLGDGPGLSGGYVDEDDNEEEADAAVGPAREDLAAVGAEDLAAAGAAIPRYDFFTGEAADFDLLPDEYPEAVRKRSQVSEFSVVRSAGSGKPLFGLLFTGFTGTVATGPNKEGAVNLVMDNKSSRNIRFLDVRITTGENVRLTDVEDCIKKRAILNAKTQKKFFLLSADYCPQIIPQNGVLEMVLVLASGRDAEEEVRFTRSLVLSGLDPTLDFMQALYIFDGESVHLPQVLPDEAAAGRGEDDDEAAAPRREELEPRGLEEPSATGCGIYKKRDTCFETPGATGAEVCYWCEGQSPDACLSRDGVGRLGAAEQARCVNKLSAQPAPEACAEGGDVLACIPASKWWIGKMAAAVSFGYPGSARWNVPVRGLAPNIPEGRPARVVAGIPDRAPDGRRTETYDPDLKEVVEGGQKLGLNRDRLCFELSPTVTACVADQGTASLGAVLLHCHPQGRPTDPTGIVVVLPRIPTPAGASAELHVVDLDTRRSEARAAAQDSSGGYLVPDPCTAGLAAAGDNEAEKEDDVMLGPERLSAWTVRRVLGRGVRLESSATPWKWFVAEPGTSVIGNDRVQGAPVLPLATVGEGIVMAVNKFGVSVRKPRDGLRVAGAAGAVVFAVDKGALSSGGVFVRCGDSKMVFLPGGPVNKYTVDAKGRAPYVSVEDGKAGLRWANAGTEGFFLVPSVCA